jgi:4'-phosphopantetheinyl transferase
MFVELWLADPEHSREPAARAEAYATLDAAERARMAQYAFERDRTLFLTARTLARRALSRHARVAPSEWIFDTSPHGRPFVAGPTPVPPLDFNLSHCDGLVACALTSSGARVGVDVERIAALPVDLIDEICSAREAAALRALPAAARAERFFTLGLGLSLPFEQVEFALDGEVPMFLPGPALEDRGEAWRFERLRPTLDHCAALCVSRRDGEPPLLRSSWLALTSDCRVDAGRAARARPLLEPA